MSTGIIHKKIIYICPAKPVAYQVGANFINMGYKVHFYWIIYPIILIRTNKYIYWDTVGS